MEDVMSQPNLKICLIRIFFLLVYMLSGIFKSTLATTPFISRVYKADGDHRLSQISMDGNDLFVGGKNILINLSENLEELQTPYLVFGPVTESYGDKCKGPLYKDGDCSTRRVDNTVSVLVVYPTGHILVCGSALDGLCSSHQKSNISAWSYLPYDIDKGFYRDSLLGSSGDNNVVITVDQNDKSIHYVARGFEQKPRSFHSHIFSVLSLRPIGEKHYFRHIDTRHADGEVYMNLNRSYQGNFTIDMVFAFQTGDFVFFVFNRNPELNSDMIEARIARIKKNCTSEYFQTYTELPIVCNHENGLMEKQPALSGYLHTDPKGNQVLFLAFYNQRSEGSSVCAYPVQDIVTDDHFSHANFHCQNAVDNDVYQPEWVSHANALCTNNDWSKTWSDCGNYRYRGLATRKFPYKKTRIISLEKQKIQTIFVSHHSLDQKPVVLLGTNDGFLTKVEISSGYNNSIVHSRKYATFDLSGDRSVPIERSQGVHSSKEHVYFLVDNKIMKISVFSCGIHTDCDTCVKSSDPLRCGWCGDECTTQNDCSEYIWHNNTCPPEVFKISPKNGTTGGHTKVTINGRYFDYEGGGLHVLIGDTECLDPVFNTSSIVCETAAANKSHNATVVVTITTNTKILQSTSKNTTFEYLIPSLDDFHPKHGPKSGFTALTLTGQNLYIGSSLAVDVSDSQSVCRVESLENDNIVCRLTRWTSTNSVSDTNHLRPSCLGYGPVVVQIDDTLLTSTEDFCYMSDPVITSITPVSTTIRGGRVVSVIGENFDAISMSSLQLFVRNNHSSIKMPSHECEFVNSELLECIYPNLETVLSSAPSGVSGNLTIILDDGIPLTNDNRRIMVYNDPVLYRVTQNISLENDYTKMILYGRYLNMAFGAKEYNVTVEGVRCPVLQLKSDTLLCDLSHFLSKLRTNRNKVYPVKVTVGPFEMKLGDLNVTVHTRSAYASIPRYQNWLWVGIAIVSVIIIIIMCVIVRKKRRQKSLKRRRNYITNNDLEGTMTFQNLMRIDTDEPSSVPNNYIHIGCEDGATGGDPPNLFVDLGTIDMLRKQHLLVSRDNLLLGESLGHGQFGCVYKGYLSKPGEKGEELVAVKTILKSSAKEVDIGEFMNEALIMKDFNHPNVLSLIGVCVDKGEFPLVILPFMENGDLLAYIRDEQNMPLVKHLVLFGLDIAKGMDYLASIKFVHRDLAARNCMLDDQFIAKVADFGLSRDIYSSHYYSSDNKKKLPVKWMAPENLEKGKYSSKSDVWSFGVVLWELITRGANPYAAVDNWDMYKYLKEGRRLPKPPFCPPRLFHMMECCWEFNPSRRPTFRDLTKEIKRLLKESEQEENSICDVTVDLESATIPS